MITFTGMVRLERKTEMLLRYERNGKVYSTEVEALPPKSIEYLLQYGWSQSLQDCIAGNAKAVRVDLTERATAAGKKVSEAEIEAAIAQDLDGALMKRSASIVAGTMDERAGVQRDPLETMKRQMAVAMVRAAFKAKNAKLPDNKTEAGRKKWREIVDATLAKHSAEITKKAQRALKEAKELPTVNLDDLGI
jgi:hypothetical protein